MRLYQIKYAGNSDQMLWDDYVRSHPQASLYHGFGWRNVIHKTYGHATYYLMASSERTEHVQGSGSEGTGQATGKILGVLPLSNLNNIIFGKNLISLPFLDSGGVLANDAAVEEKLVSEAIKLAQKLGASRIELRHEHALACGETINAQCIEDSGVQLKTATKSHKVRMLLNLPESSELLMKSFKSKLRSQIKKPLKEGLTARTGGIELLGDFYTVFSANMRDLGSPVHSIKLMRHVLSEFPQQSKIIVVYRKDEPIASSMVVGFNGMLRNPWASFLRKYASLSPNMLLYLRMLEYACDNGYDVFDFGRSSPGEGTYKFKEQWGAIPKPLHWHYISLDGSSTDYDSSDRGRFEKAIHYWRKLPLPVTKLLGPSIRKYIGL